MNSSVLVLGANGRFGRAATLAFARAGWRVRTLTRSPPAPEVAAAADGVAAVAADGNSATAAVDARVGDPLAAGTLDAAVAGVDVLVHAANMPYGRWTREALPLARAVIGAAERHGATVLLPGNVYPYGAGLPRHLDASTPFAPSEPLGRVRAAIEEELRAASVRGVRSIVLRGGDFIEGRRSGNWFENHLVGALGRGRVTYPGPLDRSHAWAWLPDMAAAAVGLASVRDTLEPAETVGFPGWSPSGRELIAALERVADRALEVRTMPWRSLRLVAPFSADIRGVLSMRWLWERPHAIDGSRLAELLPGFRATDLDSGLALALERLGWSRPSPASASTAEASVR